MRRRREPYSGNRIGGQCDKPLGSLGDDAATRYEIEGRQAQFDGLDAHISKAAKVRFNALQPAIGGD